MLLPYTPTSMCRSIPVVWIMVMVVIRHLANQLPTARTEHARHHRPLGMHRPEILPIPPLPTPTATRTVEGKVAQQPVFTSFRHDLLPSRYRRPQRRRAPHHGRTCTVSRLRRPPIFATSGRCRQTFYPRLIASYLATVITYAKLVSPINSSSSSRIVLATQIVATAKGPVVMVLIVSLQLQQPKPTFELRSLLCRFRLRCLAAR
uniref:Putative secreted peptide n=1 Tax=Anopheles braziliensis TaxID=58242 RepID=A0A2M3ZN39_9DIPT